MRPLALALVALVLAGCSSQQEPTVDAPVPNDPEVGDPETPPALAAPWAYNEAVELVECQGVALTIPVDRERIAPRLPERFSLASGAVLTMLVHVDVCESAALADRAVERQVSVVAASVTVEEEMPVDQNRQEFALDFSTSWGETERVLRGFGVPGGQVQATLQEAASGLEVLVEGNGTEYRIQFGPRVADQFAPPDSTLRYRGGPDASFDAKRIRSTPAVDRVPTACVATFERGPLSEIFPAPTPCIGSVESSGARLILNEVHLGENP